jgi:hypothetical protein
MEIRTYVQQQIAGARRLVDAAMQNTTDEQFTWTPPVDTVNPISVTFLHIVGGEDSFVQGVLQRKARLWDTDGWGDKVGIAKTPGMGEGWVEARQTPITVAAALAYQTAVRAATDAYLANLTPEELDREVDFMGGKRPVANVLIILAHHACSHAGEIATVKGMQGIKGLPF